MGLRQAALQHRLVGDEKLPHTVAEPSDQDEEYPVRHLAPHQADETSTQVAEGNGEVVDAEVHADLVRPTELRDQALPHGREVQLSEGEHSVGADVDPAADLPVQARPGDGREDEEGDDRQPHATHELGRSTDLLVRILPDLEVVVEEGSEDHNEERVHAADGDGANCASCDDTPQ